uniref:THAP-type domain-containing protein n=1 Tax=Schizaphis graminum TaxID=13262 RepID=A0A2S2ND70_SCHGA
MSNSNDKTTNSNNVEVTFFNPNPGCLDEWSSILGIKLVKDSPICSNHFRPEDIVATEVDYKHGRRLLKGLAAKSMPLPMNFNAIQSATNTKQLEFNTLPLKKYEGRNKRSRANNKKHLSKKKIRKNLINKSNTTAETLYISGNEDNVYTSAPNGTHNYVSTYDLNPTVESNTVKTNNLSKIIDNVSTSNTFNSSFIEVLPKVLANSSLSFHLQSNEEQCTNKQISAINDTKEVVTSYGKQPILKKILTENMSNIYSMYPTTSDNSSIINSSSGKTCPINVSDTSLTISEKPVKSVVDFSIVKMEPNDDMSDSLETNFEQITETHNSMHNNLQSSLIQYEPRYEQNWDIIPQQSTVNPEFSSFPTTELQIKPELVENNDDLPLPPTSIDDSLSIEMSNLNQKLKKITANSSLSITLEPFESNRAIEPSVNLFSKTPAKSSMSITLQPKLKHNPSLTTNNSNPSVTLIPNIPSTSSAMYNISQHNSTQYEQNSASTINIPNQLSSNNLIYPKFINNQMINAISPIYKPNLLELSESHEIRNPVIDRYYSLKSMPNDFNSNYSRNISEFIIDENNSEDDSRVEEKDNGFIYEISKTVKLPSIHWTSIHENKQNLTVFFQLNDFKETVKKVNFANSLVPTILMYGKKYQHNIPIKTKIQLETLLKKIDNFQQCSGNDGFNRDECIGYFEPHLADIDMCSVCQNIIKDQDMHKITTIIAYKSKTIASLENKISERKLRVNEARKMLQKNKKKENNRVLYTLDPSGISNVMNHEH